MNNNNTKKNNTKKNPPKLTKSGKEETPAQAKKEANLAKIGAEIAQKFPGDEYKGFSQRRYTTGLLTAYRERNTKPEAYASAIEQQKQKFLAVKALPKAPKVENVMNTTPASQPTKTRKAPVKIENQINALQKQIENMKLTSQKMERAKVFFRTVYGDDPKEGSTKDATRLKTIMTLLTQGKENANIRAGLANINKHMKEKAMAASTKRIATTASKKISALQKPVAEMTACELCELEKVQADPSRNPEFMARLAELRAKANAQ